MIDEGYCYLKLSESGDKALPVNCRVKTATFDDYQAKVRELETLYSFYPKTQDENISSIPDKLIVHSNYPNPFNPTTTISFSIPNKNKVELSIYNMKGQKVKTLLNTRLEKGEHFVVWNGKDKNNKSVASGLYFYKLTSGKEVAVKKMLLLK